MKVIKYLLIGTFLLVSASSLGQEKDGSLMLKVEQTKKYEDLSLIEWKKFKRFETKLKLSNSSSSNSDYQLRSYARDSIQILGVKLMAIKLLNEKKLLNRDISENKAYYTALLNELKESQIPPSEYLFLEEKMAFINQESLENELARSYWFNLGLIILCGIVIVSFFWFRAKRKPLEPSVLSRQETTVRNLILQGKTNKEIANELFISLSTVKTHITHIYNKLDVANRQELFQKSTGTST
ncbi:response regulator transcription factor [Flagellimonas sp. S174]|uniref:response regulator transcription factor n=1 Tax=Flagellimonas sp. S174 TaxID=3410790 RepID=UPI003BF4831F